MLTPVVMPQMGLEVTEGTVITIAVASGQRVSAGDVLLEIETDKALTDLTAPRDATVALVSVSEGDVVPLGAVLVVLSDGENVDGADLSAAPESPSEPVLVSASADASGGASNSSDAEGPMAATDGTSTHGHNGYGRLRVAPVARRAAERLGVALDAVSATGPRGRITLADVERAALARSAAAEATPAPHATAEEGVRTSATSAGFAEVIPLTGPRRAIARRMTASQAIPQFSLEREIDAGWLLASKDRLPTAPTGSASPNLNDMFVQALGELVLRHPALGTAYLTEEVPEPSLGRRDGADIGLAVATDRGLTVPVLRRAHERTLAELATERVRLVGEARSGRLRGQDMRGAALTISNLGGFGIDRFVAMLNPGESAILAVGRVLDRVRPEGRGFTLVPCLALTLTIDHRVIDGATGARALSELCALLEGAMTWRT